LHREPCANPFSKQANKQRVSALSLFIGGQQTHARTRHLSHLLCRYVQKIQPSLSHTPLTHSLSVVDKRPRGSSSSLSFSLCRQTSLLTLIFFSSPHQTSRRQLPSLREQSSKHELSLSPPPQMASTCASYFFFLPPPIPLQSNSRASSRAACHHGNEIELRSCAVAMTPASGRNRTGTAAPTPARSQTRSCSWCVARPGWSCTTPHTRRR